MNWTALYAILKNSINTTKAELEQEIEDKIGLTNQFLDELPEVGESGVLYFIPKDDADPSAEDQYFMYVWDPDNTEFVLLDPDVDLSPYAKSADLATVATSGLYSDLSGTPDLTPYITEDEADEKYMSYDILEEETVTGNPITFDSLEGGNIKQCEVSFGPEQDLHGYESPWPAGGGKNKLQNTMTSDTVLGVTYTVNSDGTVALSNTATADAIKVSSFTLPAGSYLYSSGANETFQTYDTYLTLRSTGTTIARGISGYESFSLSETMALNLGIRVRKGVNVNGVVIKPMVRLSTETDASFAPYSNICPISGRDSLDLYQAGVNLANTTIYKQGYILGNDGSETVSVNFCITDKCIVTGGKKYVLRWKENSSGTPAPDNVIRVGWYNSNGDFISRLAPVITTSYITAPNNAAYCKLSYVNNPENVSYKWDIMLNEGQTATDYEAYQGTTHTATFPDTVYEGSHEFVGGKQTSNKGFVIYDGTEDWSMVVSGGVNTFRIVKPEDAATGINNISNILPPSSTASVRNNSFYLGNSNIVFCCNDIASVEDWKALLSTTNLQVVYELATPIEITLTAEQIELLKGQNVLWTDGDNIELTAAQLELIKVKANPAGQATGTLEKIQIDDDIFGIPAELPVVASTDEGKVLTVNSSGEWEAADIPTQVEANPADTATTDLTKLGVGGTIYGIPAAPTIVANPSGAATDILDRLQVGSTVYATPKQMDYSTAEQKTGVKWIDGRDIYQRTFVKTLASSPDADASSFLIASGLDTIDVLIDISGTVKGNGVHAFCGTTGLINGNGWKYSIHLDSDDQLVVWAGNSSDYYNEIAGGKAFITIKYVKNLYPVSDPWPTGTGYGIGNFEWDDQMASDIATDAHSWDSRYFGSEDPWWIKYVSTNLDGSINVKAQHAWFDDEPETKNHFEFNKYYEPFYITTDTYIDYGCYAWASYTVAQDGTITRTGTGYERCDTEPKLYIRSTDSYLTQINNEWFFKMHQEIPGYLIYANWSKLSNWLVSSGDHQHIKEPLWKVN